MTDHTYKLGFLGAGNMAEAIARAALENGLLKVGDMIAADPVPQRREVFTQLGIAAGEDNVRVIREAAQIMLAVKPQTFAAVGAQLGQVDPAKQVVLSIMAGIPSGKIVALSGKPLRVVRIMPNTPVMVGAGMAGVALGQHARAGDEALTMRLFGAAGKAVLVSEQAIDAITAVSGSGPAYVFYLAEAMQKAAAELGLGEHADVLVRQTILGAAKLLSESSDTAAELRRKVTSPGGTTEAAIRHMEGQGLGAAVVEAIKAAEIRSRELGA